MFRHRLACIKCICIGTSWDSKNALSSAQASAAVEWRAINGCWWSSNKLFNTAKAMRFLTSHSCLLPALDSGVLVVDPGGVLGLTSTPSMMSISTSSWRIKLIFPFHAWKYSPLNLGRGRSFHANRVETLGEVISLKSNYNLCWSSRSAEVNLQRTNLRTLNSKP